MFSCRICVYYDGMNILCGCQRHVSVAKNRPVNFQIKNEGTVDLFEMTVELSRNRAGPTISVQTAQR